MLNPACPYVHEPVNSILDTSPCASRRDVAAVLDVVSRIVARFGLSALEPTLAACRELARPGATLDVAVLGQFKSGKSSLLNALVGVDAEGKELLPVGVLPVTAVVTRLRAGESLSAVVTRLDGTLVEVALPGLSEYVTEAGNPGNVKGVSVVDITVPSATVPWLRGLRLVDTPGLGSVHAHNSRATMDWLPGVGLALVAVSVERPLSEEDRRLIGLLRPIASRVVIVLTKADLVTPGELEQVRGYVSREVRGCLGMRAGDEPVIVACSVRTEREKHIEALRGGVLGPIARNEVAERGAALEHKLVHLARSAREYLVVALASSEKADRERAALLEAVRDESVRERVLAKELEACAESLIGGVRAEFEKALLKHRGGVEARVLGALGEMASWRGHLGEQAAKFQDFLRERMVAELSALEPEAAPVASSILDDAELRFRRIAEAFRDRVNRSVSASLGLTLPAVEWEPVRARVSAPPVSIGHTFMTHWEQLWWVLPMGLVGGLFRRHCRGKVPWEVWINTSRYVGGWFVATADAIEMMRGQAAVWVHEQVETLVRVLKGASDGAAPIRAALSELDAVSRELL